VQARLFSTALYVLLGFILAWRTWRQLSRLPTLSGDWKVLFRRFARLSFVTYASGLVLYFSDLPFVVFVLTYYGDTLGVALFAVAYGRIITPVSQFLFGSLSGIPLPMFARLYVQQDLAKLQLAFASLSRFLALLFVPAGVGLALLAPNLIRLLFQTRYEPAAAITIVLIVGLFGETLLHPAQQILIAFEENRLFLIARLITLMAAPLLFLVVPVYGALGAAAALGLVRLASRLYTVVVVQRKFNLSYPFVFFFRVLLASGFMAVAMLVPLGLERPRDPLEAVIRTALAFVVGSVVFLFAFRRLGGIEPADRERLTTLRIPFKGLILRWL
jgi:O-antigen/teichoic acid export membrane protein